MSALALYEIADQLRSLERLGESDDLPAEVIADTLEALEGDFTTKAVSVAKFVRSLEANADAIRASIAAQKARLERIEKRAESVRAYLQFWMQATERKRIEAPDLVIARRANPAAVVITDESAIPEGFWVQPPAPPKRLDKSAIKAALSAGGIVPGAQLEAGERLEIRP